MMLFCSGSGCSSEILNHCQPRVCIVQSTCLYTILYSVHDSVIVCTHIVYICVYLCELNIQDGIRLSVPSMHDESTLCTFVYKVYIYDCVHAVYQVRMIEYIHTSKECTKSELYMCTCIGLTVINSYVQKLYVHTYDCRMCLRMYIQAAHTSTILHMPRNFDTHCTLAQVCTVTPCT